MTTTTSYNGGSQWSADYLADAWGEMDSDIDHAATSKRLTEMTIARFDETASQHGSTASWIPYTSEVIHDINEPAELIEQYEDWRQEAIDSVWREWANEDIAPIYTASTSNDQ